MDPVFQTLFSWQFLTFGIAISAVVYVFRKIVEYLMVKFPAINKESKLWTELLLPISPVLMGSIGALLLSSFPYPNGLTTGSSRFIFGLVAGLLSTLLYRMVKSFLMQKIKGLTGNNSSNESPPESDGK